MLLKLVKIPRKMAPIIEIVTSIQHAWQVHVSVMMVIETNCSRSQLCSPEFAYHLWLKKKKNTSSGRHKNGQRALFLKLYYIS